MVDSLVSVRRYTKAMLAATDRSECLGLVLVAGRPSDVHTAPPAHDAPSIGAVLGPYLGVAHPVAAGHEGAGVVLPDGTRVLAGGLDARCWPGSEAAFQEELATRSPVSWERGRHARRGGGATNVAARAAAEIASSVGIDGRMMPAAAVLDPVSRHAVVISLPRGSSVWALGRRLVEEMGYWPQRRLGVVESLVSARLERAAFDRPRDPEVARLRAEHAEIATWVDDHERAVATARCHDALRVVESRRTPLPRTVTTENGPEPDGDGYRRRADLDKVIVRLRGELEHGDRSVSSSQAAIRAARDEVGSERRVSVRAPEVLAGWRIDHLNTPGMLQRLFGQRQRAVAT